MSDDLRSRFPDLQPGSKPSGLGSVNGFGSTLLGQRDYDPETGTFVLTHWVTLLFIPVIGLASYRVANSEHGGWYCLGRVPLSKRVKYWNYFLMLAVVLGAGGIAWNIHTSTPEYAAGKKLDEADEAAAAGQGGKAAKLYREVIDGRSKKADEANKKLAALIEKPTGEAPEVYAVAVDLHREHRCPVADPFATGRSLAVEYSANDPAVAAELLEVIAPLAPDTEAELALRQQLLEKVVAKSPDDVDAISKLAAVHEARGESARCEALLAPVEAKLGTREGAAILGRIHAAKGRHDKADALLGPYVAARLPALRDAQQDLSATVKAAEERVLNQMRTGKAPGFDYVGYDKAGKAKQQEMVEEYLTEQMRSDPQLRAVRKKLIENRAVVGAALDLGLVQLQRGQAKTDPAERKSELERAEKTFLSVRGFAGESEEYRLSLGQVYYWLGRPADGKKLFDELLAARAGAAEVSLQVAHVLREVGEVSEARRISEEAYAKEAVQEKKQAIASFRALLRADTDEEILWLSRADQNSPNVQADLATARGHKAERDGKDAEAVTQYQKALDAYSKMPDSAATFNNSALALFSLYEVTRNREDLSRGLDRLDRAIALKPSDSILLFNGASTAMQSAIRDVIGGEFDLRAIKSRAGWDAVPYLYRTPAERDAIVKKIVNHPAAVKGRTYGEKVVLLSPKRDESYQMVQPIYDNSRDFAALKDLIARAEKAGIDTVDDRKQYMEFIEGKSDEKTLTDVRANVTRTTTSLETARPIGGKTLALAAGRYIRAKIAAWCLAEPVDADELVKLAEQAHAAAPSTGTEYSLTSALLFRVHLTLIKTDAGYAALAKRTQRTFGSQLPFHVLAAGEAKLKSTAAALPDVKRVAVMALDIADRFPDDVTEWIAVRAAMPEKAKALEDKARANVRVRLNQQYLRAVSPYSAATFTDDYWTKLLDGKDAEAKAVLAAMNEKGLPAP